MHAFACKTVLKCEKITISIKDNCMYIYKYTT